jgi:hypothetical protein
MSLWALALLVFTQPLDGMQSAPAPAIAAEKLAKDKLTKDGYWEIEAVTLRGDRSMAIDKALYHAATLAAAGGHKYVEMHDGYSTSTERFGRDRAVLFARASDAPAHPAKCRSGKPKRCYTADVALLIRQLSGASGKEPGMPIPSYDKYGRTVLESGFGIGAIGS